MTKYHFLLYLSILLTAAVQASLKVISIKHDGVISNSLHDPRLYFVAILYGLALCAWFVSASRIQYSVLIPTNILTVVLGGFVGYFLFGETIEIRKLLAYGLICSGVLLLLTDTTYT
mgnify:FL=1